MREELIKLAEYQRAYIDAIKRFEENTGVTVCSGNIENIQVMDAGMFKEFDVKITLKECDTYPIEKSFKFDEFTVLSVHNIP